MMPGVEWNFEPQWSTTSLKYAEVTWNYKSGAQSALYIPCIYIVVIIYGFVCASPRDSHQNSRSVFFQKIYPTCTGTSQY